MSQKLCRKCGTPNTGEMSFCLNCGQNLFDGEDPLESANDLPQTVLNPAARISQPNLTPQPTVFIPPQQQQSQNQPQFTLPQQQQTFGQNFQPQGAMQNVPTRHKAVAITAFVLSLFGVFLYIFSVTQRWSGILFFWLGLLVWLITFGVGILAVVLRFAVPKHFGGRSFAITSVLISLIMLFVWALRLLGFF